MRLALAILLVLAPAIADAGWLCKRKPGWAMCASPAIDPPPVVPEPIVETVPTPKPKAAPVTKKGRSAKSAQTRSTKTKAEPKAEPKAQPKQVEQRQEVRQKPTAAQCQRLRNAIRDWGKATVRNNAPSHGYTVADTDWAIAACGL